MQQIFFVVHHFLVCSEAGCPATQNKECCTVSIWSILCNRAGARACAHGSHSCRFLAAVDKSYLHILLQASLWAPVCAPHQPLTSVRLCACFSKSAFRLSACLTWKELLWLWRTNTISRRSGGLCEESWGGGWGVGDTKDRDVRFQAAQKGLWQSMTFWERDKIRARFRMAEVIFPG